MFENLIAAIAAKFPDNNQNLITPEWARDAFLYAVQSLGIDSEFLGYAPYSNPVAQPDGKCWYITNPHATAVTSQTYVGYGSNKVVKVGMCYIVWWNGSTWQWIIVERDFQNANYGTNGRVLINVPDTLTPYTPSNPRLFTVLSDASAVDNVVRMQVDGEDVEIADYVEFGDSLEHIVALTMDGSQFGDGTPDCFDGVDGSIIELPYGIGTLNSPVGTTNTTLVLPETVYSIEPLSITNNNASKLTLKGAPPEFGNLAGMDWSGVTEIVIPSQFATLYKADEDWTSVIDTVLNNGGSVTTESGITWSQIPNPIPKVEQTADEASSTYLPLLYQAMKPVTEGSKTDSVAYSKQLKYKPSNGLLVAPFFSGDGSLLTNLPSAVPIPTAADEGKMLQVNASGQYELVTIVNSELQPY